MKMLYTDIKWAQIKYTMTWNQQDHKWFRATCKPYLCLFLIVFKIIQINV